VDVVRLLTFSAVIAVHTLAFTEQPDNRMVAGAMMLLQYGREVFFALTGFVLVYSTMGRPLRAGSFWRKRVAYVAVPYLAWSVLYYAYAVFGPDHLRPSVASFGWDLLYGSAEYHLYFLLVTLQLYLAFPWISRFVHRTAHRAGPVLAAVAVVNLLWMAVVAYVPTPASGVPAWLFDHAYELLPSYAMYVLAGCYAAVHLDRIQAFVQRRSTSLLKLAGLSALGAVVVYLAQLPFMAPRTADQVIQPGSIFSCVAALIVTYVIGARWASGPRRRQRTIEVLSDASFGVYLAHPLVLLFLTDYLGFGNNGQRLAPALATALGFLVAMVAATFITLAARRTPLSLALSGRPWRASVKRHAKTEVLATC
jgi:peptidoglycan/LPS O-acetylase OafA/YrhL